MEYHVCTSMCWGKMFILKLIGPGEYRINILCSHQNIVAGPVWFICCSCLNQCTYCKTKHARGDLGSYPPEEIVSRAKQAFQGQ